MTAFTAPRRGFSARHAKRSATSAGSGAATRIGSSTSRWSSTPLLLVVTVGVLNLIGVVMVLSASSVASLTDYGSPWYFFSRQLLWTVLGIIAFVFGLRIDYRVLRRLVRPLLFARRAAGGGPGPRGRRERVRLATVDRRRDAPVPAE